MKIKCRPRKVSNNSPIQTRQWSMAFPFNINPRGLLVHRVRNGASHFHRGEYSHDSVTYWCGNSATGEGVKLSDSLPSDRLLCAHCENRAVAAGELSAPMIVGRPVHTGLISKTTFVKQ
jgi:hypothetical protein